MRGYSVSTRSWNSDAPDPTPHLPDSLETHDLDRMDISFSSFVERMEAGQLPDLREVTYRKFYGQDEDETEEVSQDWDYDFESL
ncbi:hypothetical protein N7516_007982 [Penicillium verrucosum]|uniref:uncharacterized protein n=1 Tax=Penicillium verrucosum TaxID=60171 RepID=UPI002545836A|nr:uncharacterized protein N7516_007982 [Penicillium verrucosum]KAJ5926209.1 hypothetical protein N7516_007982 [Penicillium verrucosum]